eukprot:Skav206052  [mRNA]  locus=scaffold587:300125:300856:+ [translate_table: standard]
MESLLSPALAFAFAWALLAALHITLTRSDLSAGIAQVLNFCGGEHVEGRRNQRLRYEQELRRTRAQKLCMISKLLVHTSCFLSFVASWRLMQEPTLTTLAHFMAGLMSYPLFALAERSSGQDDCNGYVQALHVCTQAFWAIGIAHEPDFLTFCMLQTCVCVGLILMSMVFINLKVMLPLFLCEASLMISNQWRLMGGVSNLSSLSIYCSILPHLCVAFAIVFVDHTMRSMSAAKLWIPVTHRR